MALRLLLFGACLARSGRFVAGGGKSLIWLEEVYKTCGGGFELQLQERDAVDYDVPEEGHLG